MSIEPSGKLCPSSTCQDGAILLGVVQEDGRVSFLNDRITIDQEFVDIAHEGRPPEKRFRFANKCVKSGCKQWTGTRCGVIDKVERLATDIPRTTELPACTIRPSCRWFSQSGARACDICPFVITDSRQYD